MTTATTRRAEAIQALNREISVFVKHRIDSKIVPGTSVDITYVHKVKRKFLGVVPYRSTCYQEAELIGWRIGRDPVTGHDAFVLEDGSLYLPFTATRTFAGYEHGSSIVMMRRISINDSGLPLYTLMDMAAALKAVNQA